MSKYIDADKLLQELFNVDEEEWTTPEIRAILENAPNITPTVSEDCISREWLINHFKDMVEHYEMRIKRVERHGEKTTYDTSEQIGYWKDEIADYKYFIREIKNAPSVEPKRPKGKWVLHPLMDEGRVELECSECGNTFVRSVGFRPHFCEHCGARMGK